MAELRQPGRHDPWRLAREDAELAGVLDALRDGAFANGDAPLLRGIWSSLMEHGDRFMHVADFRPYADAQLRVERLFRDPRAWAAKAIRNVARMGAFSSDRAVTEYAREVWGLVPLRPSA